MSEVRIPRKHKGEVLSQSSEHAKAVRRQPKGRAGIKGRREFDMHAERGQQNPFAALVQFLTSPLPLEVRYGVLTTFQNSLSRALQGDDSSMQGEDSPGTEEPAHA